MVRDALNAIDRGYNCLKVKVGKEPVSYTHLDVYKRQVQPPF